MFVREKTARGHSYLYLVENEREGGRIRQRIIRALGRKDVLLASGELDRLAASLARHCDRAVMLSDMEAGRIAARALAARCCSGGCGSGSALPRSWASCCRTPVLSLPSSAPSLPAFCTGCLCRARTAAARNGWLTTRSPRSMGCSCTTSTGRWLGLARRSLPPPVPWRRAAPRT